VGWLWFLVMLLPVIGLLQVGAQAWADRYAYLPLIGIYLMVAFAAHDFVSRHSWTRIPVAVAACCMIGALAAAARLQVDRWRNSQTLYEHALRVTHDNWLAHNELGVVMAREGKIEEGRRHFNEALRLQPDYADAYSNLSLALLFQGNLEEARRHCERALTIRPDHAGAHFVLACVLDQQGHHDAARDHFEQVLKLRPEYAEVHYRLGLNLRTQGRAEEALPHFEEALRLKPDDPQTQLALAALLAAWSKASPSQRDEALALARRVAERTRYREPAPLATLAAASAATGRFDEAVEWMNRALAVAPDTLRSTYRRYRERYRSGKPLIIGSDR
jgi:tetratricopeptide (TPR) repeat protein